MLSKKEAPFAEASLPPGCEAENLSASKDALLTSLASVNEIIRKHNTIANDFQKEIDRACAALERSYVAAAYEDYKVARDALAAATGHWEELATKPGALSRRIDELERAMRERRRHRRPGL